MFTQTLKKRVLGSNLVDLLTGPHGVDRYTELVEPTWTLGEARAKVVDVRRTTPRSVTLTLAPNDTFTAAHIVQAGQYVNLTIDIDGRRHTRCYSPANTEGSRNLELTIGHHDGGLVSTYLYERAHRGMVVGLAGVGGDFVLPALGSFGSPRRILFVSGGSGITPVMAMLRTLVAERHQGEIAFVHYARYHEYQLKNVKIVVSFDEAAGTVAGPIDSVGAATVIVTVAGEDVPALLLAVYVNESAPAYPTAGL